MDIKFINNDGDFVLENANETSYLYFPIANEGGIMGSISPDLNGDSKISQDKFLLKPVSSEDLHSSNMARNVWVKIDQDKFWSISNNLMYTDLCEDEEKKDNVTVTAGKLWHKVTRTNKWLGIESNTLNYSPATNENVEIMKVTFKNTKIEDMELEATVAIPIYARSADDLRDHRHVTSLLNQIQVKEDGIVVQPTISFDERGHKINHQSFAVYARGDSYEKPEGFFPVMEEFIGEGRNLNVPEAVFKNSVPLAKSGYAVDGYEAMGGIRFGKTVLKPEEEKTYYIILSYNEEGRKYLEKDVEAKAFDEMKEYWNKQNTIRCQTKDSDFDQWVNWIGIQPTLRRIYGCSFLPHHDYGRGGRGWRDLWQDSLALLLMDSGNVRESLVSYFAGVRFDGSNATIIGSEPGEFIADRNAITRLWMDHGVWPFITINLYINQTGDYGILFDKTTYFNDGVIHRGEDREKLWVGKSGHLQTPNDEDYQGTILEHILIQHYCAFYDVGEKNNMKLRGADWNDALDMAKENGESVAFTMAYAGNFVNLAKLLEYLRLEQKIEEIELTDEIILLINQESKVYNSPSKKQSVLYDYCESGRKYISGNKIKIKTLDLEKDLQNKAIWMKENIRKNELKLDEDNNCFYNGYYDNEKRQVEGQINDDLRIMLTSQVFSIMSGTATDLDVFKIAKTVDRNLYDSSVGGYKLNTNFNEIKMDLGRMFGFAYGHKENGAVFCHMAVMYSYALYERGFVHEGFKVINTLYDHVMNFETSRIYPGIPEYFNPKGRGMYHYLTGSASWFMFIILTQMYGVRGQHGDLALDPKLVLSQFDDNGISSIETIFAGKNIKVTYENKEFQEIGDYEIVEVLINDKVYPISKEKVIIKREDIEASQNTDEYLIKVILS